MSKGIGIMRRVPAMMASWRSGELTELRAAIGDRSRKGARPSKGRELSIGMGSVWSLKGWDQTVFLCMGWHLGAHFLQRNTSPCLDFGMRKSDWLRVDVPC